MWNTGCRMVANGLADAINILDGENQSLAITVPSNGAVDFNSVIFPWCNDANEVTTKAFRVSNTVDGTTKPFLYLFQEYTTNLICWSLAADGPWDKRRVINDGVKSNASQAPLAAIDIFILADRVWGEPATNNNALFQQVLTETLGVASTVGAIAQAGAAIAAIPSAAAAAAALQSDTPAPTAPTWARPPLEREFVRPPARR